MPLDPNHPTLHRAGDLAVGWTVLHLGQTGNNQRVESVTEVPTGLHVVVADGSEHTWRPDDVIHAAEPEVSA